MKKIKLSNGVEMPQLGYGVYQVEPDECERCVLDALSVGYRMIDTAQAYLNEEAVGNAWKKSGVNRDEIFLVSKVWLSNYGEGQTMKSIDESLRKMQQDFAVLKLKLLFIFSRNSHLMAWWRRRIHAALLSYKALCYPELG